MKNLPLWLYYFSLADGAKAPATNSAISQANAADLTSSPPYKEGDSLPVEQR
ncbi:MAG: hypothetical protein RID09_18695 [Coleofasciculus sp. G1-WW12-02]|uniref:hypothetical protein n=1 Tax=unclassified Coleofasciculus TaxID=2692782 RepID=UPI0033008936